MTDSWLSNIIHISHFLYRTSTVFLPLAFPYFEKIVVVFLVCYYYLCFHFVYSDCRSGITFVDHNHIRSNIFGNRLLWKICEISIYPRQFVWNIFLSYTGYVRFNNIKMLQRQLSCIQRQNSSKRWMNKISSTTSSATAVVSHIGS